MEVTVLQGILWIVEDLADIGEMALVYGIITNERFETSKQFVIMKNICDVVMYFSWTNERIISLRFKGTQKNRTMINVFPPTEDTEVEIKEDIYNTLQRATEKIQNHDILIVI